ncbi:MAG: hypothetical protein JSR58_08230 [Verrucomicrobia bacterium]|nr:hypothetical protein [Verrucomicrobiota bacterium]
MNPEVFFAEGLELLEVGKQEKKKQFLHLACKKFQKATDEAPSHLDAWKAWGTALELLGEPVLAKEKYAHLTPSPELYRSLGRVSYQIAEESGEITDIKEAVQWLEKAEGPDCPGDYWIERGKAYLLMSEKVRDYRLITRAIQAFKKGVSMMIGSATGWKHLAAAMQKFYLHSQEEDHFSQASDCYAAALQLHPSDGELWLEWAEFLLDSGRKTRDEKKLNLGVEKCRQAHVYLPKDPHVLAAWAQILALLGEITERADLLFEAEAKMNTATEMDEDDPWLSYAFGMCYISFADYFEDPDYLLQAIEKLQWSLSLDRTLYQSWHAMAKCFQIYASIQNDTDSLQKAIRFYSKAETLFPSRDYIVDGAIALTQLGEINSEPTLLEEAIRRFEWALDEQKNALYSHTEWFFYYACALDLLASHLDEEHLYLKAIEMLSHVIMVEPAFPHLHHKVGLVLSHLADFRGSPQEFYRAQHHYRLALKADAENDFVLVDWGVSLMNLSEYLLDTEEKEMVLREAHAKLSQAAALGSVQSFYHLACFHSLLHEYEMALYFLEKSRQANVLPTLDEILDEEWLEGLRMTSHFQNFLTQIEKK